MAAGALFEKRGERRKTAAEPVSKEILTTAAGNIVFPSQQTIHRKITHALGVFLESEARIRPHFHLTGESGSGKSFLTKMVCEEHKVPFIEVNAAGLTAEGLSGNSLSKALTKLKEHWNEPNVIFVDEFDKLFQRNGETTEGFRTNVQDEFLTALESKYVSVFSDYGKYPQIVVENSLFIFAGAYSNQKITNIRELKDAGLRTEFVGRVPLVFMTESVPMDELRASIPQLALFRNYRALAANKRTKEAADVAGIVKIMVEQSDEMNIGIRMLNSAIHQHFMRNV